MSPLYKVTLLVSAQICEESVWVSEREAWGISKRFFSCFCGIWISESVLFVAAKYWLCFQWHFRIFEQALLSAVWNVLLSKTVSLIYKIRFVCDEKLICTS